MMALPNAAGAGTRSLPLIFDALAVFLALQAHLVAALTILAGASHYSSLVSCAALMAVSVTVPLGCVVAARRAGGSLSDRGFRIAAAGLLVVEFGQVLVLPVDQLGSPRAFGWGAVGVSVLICAAFRPARDVLWLAALIAVPVLILLAPQLRSVDGGAFRFLATLSGTTLPALAAAQYLGAYVRALGRRQRILSESVTIASRLTAARLVRQDSERRLASVRAELIPLLSEVSAGTVRIGDPGVADRARALGDALRRELVETRSGRWLIDSPLPGSAPGTADWPGVTVLDPASILLRLTDETRSGISVLLGSLRAHPGWRQVSVALADGPADAVAAVTVVATGSFAADAADDPVVRSAAQIWGARLELEDPDVLVADAEIELADRATLTAELAHRE